MSRKDPLADAMLILDMDFERPRRMAAPKPAKPTHYKALCISMYTKDIEALDAKVLELKRRGYTKANRSKLIRLALSQVDLEKILEKRE